MASNVREQLVEKLIAEYGEPWRLGNNFRWAIRCGNHAPINLCLNCWRTPNDVAIWVFDPRKPGTTGVTYSKLHRADEVEDFIARLRADVADVTEL